MKNNTTSLILLFLIVLSSCSEKHGNFSEYEWIVHYNQFNDDYSKLENHQRILFKNDSIICFSKLTGESIKFPLKIKDSLIVFKSLYTIIRKGEEKKDTIVTDSLWFDFKKIFGKPLLIVKHQNPEYYDVLTASEDNIELEETNNFLSIINFKIGGLQIGDTISLQNFENIKDKKTYGGSVVNLITANPIGNENIEVVIIDKKFIFSIIRKKITLSEIDNIIRVVNEKVKIIPDTIKKSKPFYREGYRWLSKEIEVELIKEDKYQYYMDQSKNTTIEGLGRYGSQLLRLKYIESAKKEIENSKYYELEYNNQILQKILKNTGNNSTQSSIIE